MSNDKNKFKVEEQEANTALTTADLKYIIDVNKKAIEIYIEVDKQNEKILEIFNEFQELFIGFQVKLEKHQDVEEELLQNFKLNDDKNSQNILKIQESIAEIDKNLFRLAIILGSTGIGAIISLIFSYLRK